MYIIDKNNKVTLTRGDSMKLKVNLTFGTFPYQEEWALSEGDVVLFGLMLPNQPFENAILHKELTIEDYDSEGNLYVYINPEDTFDLLPGTYYYSIKVIYSTEEDSEGVSTVDTVIQKTRFILVD